MVSGCCRRNIFWSTTAVYKSRTVGGAPTAVPTLAATELSSLGSGALLSRPCGSQTRPKPP